MSSSNCIVIIKTSQLEVLTKQFGKTFEQYCFTRTERQMSEISTNLMQFFASRLAAKISVLKTLGLKGDSYLLWQNVEIQRLPTGEPTIALYAKCQEHAVEQGTTRWLLSISHTPCYAAASTIALRHH